eukprot:Gb_21653 [translate_table: standard]
MPKMAKKINHARQSSRGALSRGFLYSGSSYRCFVPFYGILFLEAVLFCGVQKGGFHPPFTLDPSLWPLNREGFGFLWCAWSPSLPPRFPSSMVEMTTLSSNGCLLTLGVLWRVNFSVSVGFSHPLETCSPVQGLLASLVLEAFSLPVLRPFLGATIAVLLWDEVECYLFLPALLSDLGHKWE